MLQLLNPTWLLAISAIIIPLAIHLWNVKKGKTLKIGSVRLLGENSRQNSSSLRFEHLWLLILRCLLLVILAMLLARPVIMQKTPEQKARGWVLIDQAHLTESYTSFKPQIDSLLKAGFESHYFNPGFKVFNLADTQKKDSPGGKDFSDNLSYWSLANALDKQLPANTRAYIFTGNYQNRFTGNRPKLRSTIIWNTYSATDSVYNSIANAYLTQTDSLRLILAQSLPGGLIYTPRNTTLNEVDPAYELLKEEKTAIRFAGGQMFSKSTDSLFIAVDTSEMRIALFTDKHPADLVYLKAALQTIQSFSQRKISIKSYRNANELPERLNWLFWLSEVSVGKSIRNKSANLFSYQSGKTLELDKSWILANDPDLYDLKNMALFKRKSVGNFSARQNILWKDEMGKPILTQAKSSGITEYMFYSRFDPEWNDLVWDPRYPETMLNLILPQPEKTDRLKENDRQTLAISQIIPASKHDAGAAAAKPEFKATQLDKYFWILLMILFALERWLSAKEKSMNTND